MENVILTLLAAALLARQDLSMHEVMYVPSRFPQELPMWIKSFATFPSATPRKSNVSLVFVSAAISRLSDSIIHLSDLRSQHDLHRCVSHKLQDVEHLRVFHRKLEPLRLVALISSHYSVFLPFLLSQRIVMKSHFFPNPSLLCSVGLGVFGR